MSVFYLNIADPRGFLLAPQKPLLIFTPLSSNGITDCQVGTVRIMEVYLDLHKRILLDRRYIWKDF